jgi:hypothetical protein
MRILAASVVVLCLIANQSFGQLPPKTSVAWVVHTNPAHTSPTFKLKDGDNTKSSLTSAQLTVQFAKGKNYEITKATLIVKVSGGDGVWNPGLSLKGGIQKGTQEPPVFTLVAADTGTLTYFDVATDIRIEWDIEFSEVGSTTVLKSTIGSKVQKPTAP